MKIFLDTNIALDYLLPNPEFFAEAKQIWEANLMGEIRCGISATSVTDIHYVAIKHARRNGLDGSKAVEFADNAISLCLNYVNILSVDHLLLSEALAAQGRDFEDNLQMAVAQRYEGDFIITRNVKDFESATTQVIAPSDFVQQHLITGSSFRS